MNERTKRLSEFREKINGTDLSMMFAYITDDYNAAIKEQNETNRRLSLELELKEQRIKRLETVIEGSRILLDSTYEIGCVSIGDPSEDPAD